MIKERVWGRTSVSFLINAISCGESVHISPMNKLDHHSLANNMP